MSDVEFKEWPGANFFFMWIGSMLHVDFKKWPCRPVKLRVTGHSEAMLNFMRGIKL